MERLHRRSPRKPSFSLRLAAAVGVLACAVALLSGCSILSNKKTAILWTDRASMLPYIEEFNTDQNEYKVEPVYVANPARSMEEEKNLPDLVVAEHLNSRPVIKHFASLDSLVERKRIDAAAFYPGLLDMGKSEGHIMVLPVSFDLPILIFSNGHESSIPDATLISLQQARAMSKSFNKGGAELTRVGFSPHWQPQMMYEISSIDGAAFGETAEGTPIWDQTKLGQAVSFVSDWIDSVNGGITKEKAFVDKYMYDPGYKLVDMGRILFYYMKLSQFATIPSETRERLDFRLLSDGQQVPVLDPVLFIGRPRESTARKAANAFISWFMQPDNQIKLLKTTQFQQTRTFGIADGLSSLQTVNYGTLPHYFPFLLGHLPPAEGLRYPGSLPATWETIKEDVIYPWLLAAAINPDEKTSLADRLRAWKLQHPNPW